MCTHRLECCNCCSIHCKFHLRHCLKKPDSIKNPRGTENQLQLNVIIRIKYNLHASLLFSTNSSNLPYRYTKRKHTRDKTRLVP